MKRSYSIVAGVVLFLILSACGNRPSWVLSEKKMEDLLFDVYLAEAEVENDFNLYRNNPGNNKRQELLDAVFKKHKITQQQFDTSLVWYNAHLEFFFKINDEIAKRYTALSDALQPLITEESRLLSALNRVNIWTGEDTYLLDPASESQNTITFKIDSIDWQKGDHFELSFHVLGFHSSIHPEVVFYAACEDSVIINKSRIETNGLFSGIITPVSSKVKSLSGFVHLSENHPKICLLLHNFRIYHLKQAVSSAAVSQSPDLR